MVWYFDLFLKVHRKTESNGEKELIYMIFFVYTDVKNMGVKTPVQDLNKEEK